MDDTKKYDPAEKFTAHQSAVIIRKPKKSTSVSDISEEDTPDVGKLVRKAIARSEWHR